MPSIRDTALVHNLLSSVSEANVIAVINDFRAGRGENPYVLSRTRKQIRANRSWQSHALSDAEIESQCDLLVDACRLVGHWNPDIGPIYGAWRLIASGAGLDDGADGAAPVSKGLYARTLLSRAWHGDFRLSPAAMDLLRVFVGAKAKPQ